MNISVYENNMKALREKHENWAKYIENKEYNGDKDISLFSEKSVQDEVIFKVIKNEPIYYLDENSCLNVRFDKKTYYLNGKYKPETPVEEWLKKNGKIELFSTIIIIGLSNGNHVKRILENIDKKVNIILYEPCINVFLKALEEVDLTYLFQEDKALAIIVDGINEKEAEFYFRRMISFDNMAFLKYYISGNYSKLFPNKVSGFVDLLKKHIHVLRTQWNTTVRFTDVNAKNIFNNIRYVYDGYSVGDLHEILPKGIPAIVVSAGPSLNENIKELKKAVGKACIIATDTAMKPLLKEGIIPNFFVIVDGLKPALLFDHPDISKVPMVTMCAVSDGPMKIHKGKKFFYDSGSEFERKVVSEVCKYNKEAKPFINLPSGGSVATSAYSLGIFMGASTVILMGQDLAMTNNKTHADGTFQDKMEEINTQSNEYFEVEDIHGGRVLTRHDFKNYQDWFEDRIVDWTHIKTIDATEGGAKIRGAKIMTLKEAIKQECNTRFNVKWKVSRLPKFVNEKSREKVLKIFSNSPRKLQEVKKRAKRGILLYSKLITLSKKENINQEEMSKLLKEIKKINDYMEHDYMAETVADSLKGVEYNFRANIYRTQEDEREEMQDIAMQGKFILKAVTYAVDELTLLAEETVVRFAKKKMKKRNKME